MFEIVKEFRVKEARRFAAGRKNINPATMNADVLFVAYVNGYGV